jgi:hypothetical protein
LILSFILFLNPLSKFTESITMAATESEFTSEFQEWSPDAGHQKAVRTSRAIESTRLGLTVLALLSAIIILATSADTLAVYNQTHLSEEFFLALWPSDFDIRPTTALVICGAIVILSSVASLAVSRVPSVSLTHIHIHSPSISSTDHNVTRSEANPSSTTQSPSSPPPSPSSPA